MIDMEQNQMILTKGDIFRANAQALVNPVNCVGVMGAGLAKAFRDRFPENYRAYRDACSSGTLKTGQPLCFWEQGLLIINFPTKHHWKHKSRLADIDLGLGALVRIIHATRIQSIALPALGCGLGGLDWPPVLALMERHLDPVAEQGIQVTVFRPR